MFPLGVSSIFYSHARRCSHPSRANSPAQKDSFCSCYRSKSRVASCTCGEPGKVIEWVWDESTKSDCTQLVNNNKDAQFHQHFSRGTAVIRGTNPITANQHYWEVKMTSLVYGTDMMVGVGTEAADIHKFSDKFCSVLGIDAETWGLSYRGSFHHRGMSKAYASGFGQGSIIGVHLDMWNGTLSFYKNRQPLGVACSGLKGKKLYPMVSSTAARSGMRIIHSVSFPSSLQFLCCVALRKVISPDKSVLDVIPVPRRMQMFLANNLGWLLGEDRFEDNCEKQPEVESRESLWNYLLQRNPYACRHEHLTCNDCNILVSPGTSRNDIFHEADTPSTGFVLVGQSVMLQNHNRFQRHHFAHQPVEHCFMDSEEEDDDEPMASETKKLRNSYNFAVGLSDDDESDKMM